MNPKPIAALLGAAWLSLAHADNTLTLYGTIDGGIQSLSKDRFGERQTTFQDSPATSNRFGARGAIDLVDGWQATANLEGRYFLNGRGPAAEYQSNGNVVNRLFDRNANIGLSGPWGQFRLGLIDNPVTYAHVQGDIRPAANSGGGIFGWFRNRSWVSSCTDGTCDFTYLQHALSWRSPAVSGFTGSAFYVIGSGNRDANTTSGDNNSGYGLAVNYAADGITANAGAQEMKDQTGVKIGRAVVLNGGYTVGPFAARLSTAEFRQYAGGFVYPINSGIVTTAKPSAVASVDQTNRLHSLGVAYQPSPAWRFTAAQYAYRRKDDGTNKIDLTTLSADYTFNRYAAAYAIVSNARNGSNADQSAGYYSLITAKGSNNSAVTIGLRASFDAMFKFGS